jgi:hypothetical protein
VSIFCSSEYNAKNWNTISENCENATQTCVRESEGAWKAERAGRMHLQLESQEVMEKTMKFQRERPELARIYE